MLAKDLRPLDQIKRTKMKGMHTLHLAGGTLVVQPTAQTYLAPARALAVGLLWKMTGVNAGFGVGGHRGSPAGGSRPTGSAGAGYPAVTLAVALGADTSPLHMAQITVAEWLLVFAALQGRGAITMTSFAWPPDEDPGVVEAVPVLQTRQQAAAMLSRGLPTEFAWTPEVMLSVVADCLGGALPVYAAFDGDPDAFLEAAEPFQALWALLRPRGPRLQALVRAGASLPVAVLVDTIHAVCTTHAGLLSTQVVLLQGGVEQDETPPVLLTDTVPAAHCMHHEDWHDEGVPVPTTCTGPVAANHLEQGHAVGIVHSKGAVFPVLSAVVTSHPLQQLVLNTAATTMVAVVPDGSKSITGRSHLRDLDGLRAAAAGLFYWQEGPAVAAVVTAFWERFRDQHWSKSHTRDAPGLLLQLPVEGRRLRAPSQATPLHLYFVGPAFTKVLPTLGPLADFLDKFNLVVEGGVPGTPDTLVLVHQGLPAAKFVMDKSGAVFRGVSMPAAAPRPALASPSLLVPMMWSWVLSREDVLAVAASGPEATAAFASLFATHVDYMRLTRLYESTEGIGAALASGCLFSTGQGASLATDTAVMELVMPLKALGTGQALLQKVFQALQWTVVRVQDDARTLLCDAALVARAALDDLTGAVHPLEEPIPVPGARIKARTSTLASAQCGIVLAANSVQAAVCLGNDAVVDAVQAVAAACEHVSEACAEAKARVATMVDKR